MPLEMVSVSTLGAARRRAPLARLPGKTPPVGPGRAHSAPPLGLTRQRLILAFAIAAWGAIKPKLH